MMISKVEIKTKWYSYHIVVFLGMYIITEIQLLKPEKSTLTILLYPKSKTISQSIIATTAILFFYFYTSITSVNIIFNASESLHYSTP